MVTSKTTTTAQGGAGASAGTTKSTSTSTPTSTVTSPTTTTPKPSGPSVWDRPSLVHPQTITITASNRNLKLSQSQDFILRCPKGRVTLPSKLVVWGGHNVLLENCNLHINGSDWVGYLQHQTGTLWIHDVHFGGAYLTGGVQLQEPGATVVMRDVLFDKVYGSQSTNHAELIQTWAGPRRLLIDGLTGSTTYQGLFLEPNQFDNGPPPTVFDLRHIDIDDSRGAYALWLGDVSGSPPGDESGAILTWNVQDVHVVPNPARTWPGWWLWPQPSTGDPTWAGVIAGAPPGGSYVQATAGGAGGVDEGTSPPALAGEQQL
jgi:hypothetical protein